MTNEVEDFGFVLFTEEELAPPIDTKASDMYALIIPLLTNLAKDPDKDIIKWPGKARVKTAEDIIAKLTKIMQM